MAYSNVGRSVEQSNTTDLPEETEIVDDLSIVPLAEDSFAICELCGRVGRRENFCVRNNKFCSAQCLTSSLRKKHRYNWKFELLESAEHMAGLIPLEPLPQLQWPASLNDLQAGPLKVSTAVIANSYQWKDELFGCDFLAAPVSLFKHAPLHDMWDTTFEGMKVEVRNTDCENYSEKEKSGDYFWVATVLKVKGYMGLLRYEGFGSDCSKDFWVNLCCSEVHPVGWCATRGKPLIPPHSIEDKYTDWKKFLVKQLTGARTLPANFYNKLNDSLLSRFSIGSVMEVVDKNRISQVKVASVCEIVGKRLHVKYYDSSPEDNGFWCHEDSPLIHPVGWAFRVGHPLDAPQNYIQRVAAGRLMPNDTTPEMFYKYPSNEPPLFMEGVKLEAIDPLNLSAVCAATVMQILHEGYMMIRIESYPPDTSGGDWFCYHQRSPCIFPVGFALANNIPLVPPHGFTPQEFSWETYLALTGSCAASRSCFAARGHVVSHGFVAGMRLECADLMDPRLVCVATIARVVADLLKVHFDGWGTEYDQWLWAHSTDMYPVGWCRAVGHRLEGPLQPAPRHARKPPAKAPRRKRRQVKVLAPHPPNIAEEGSQNSDMSKSISPPASLSEVSPPDRREPSMEVDPPHNPVSHEMLHVKEEIMDIPLHLPTEITHTEKEMYQEEPPPEVPEFHDETSDFASGITELSEPIFPEICSEFTELNTETPLTSELTSDFPEDTMKTSITSELTSDFPVPIMKTSITSELTSDFPEDTMKTSITSELTTDFPEDTMKTSITSELTSDFPGDTMKDSEEKTELSPQTPETESDPSDKVIPKLVDTIASYEALNSVDPDNWTTADVAKFLTVNNCQPYCEYFAHITGPMMLQLSKDKIIELLKMKVGPSVKIFDLIQQLKCKIKQPQCRLSSLKQP